VKKAKEYRSYSSMGEGGTTTHPLWQHHKRGKEKMNESTGDENILSSENIPFMGERRV